MKYPVFETVIGVGEIMGFFKSKSKAALKKLFKNIKSVPEITVVGCDNIVKKNNVLLELFGKGCRYRWKKKGPDVSGI